MTTYAPAIAVQAAFGQNALGTALTWTTISEAQGGQIRRGRSSQLDYFTPGALTAAISDTTRKYDPMNTAGAYAGSLLPNTPVRVIATYSGGTYERFTGFVDEWTVNPRVRDAPVTMTATDGFKILANLTLRSVYEYEVLSDSPHLYWLLGEDGTKAADSSGNKYDGLYSDEVVPNGPALRYGGRSVSPAVLTGQRAMALSDADASRVTTAPPFTVEMWIGSDGAITRDSTFELQYLLFEQGDLTTSDNRVKVSFRYGATGTPTNIIEVFAPASADDLATWSTAAPNLLDGSPRHLVVVVESTGTTIYINGTSIGARDSAIVAGGSSQPNRVALGGLPGFSVVTNYRFPGAVSDLATYPTALSSTQITDHYQTGTNPWDGDYPGTRIGRILDAVGWPASLRDLDDGELVLGNADPQGMKALAYLQLVAKSEGGRLFMSGDGKVTFHDAARVRANTTASVTFSDDGSDSGYLHGSVKYTIDDRHIYNRASVQRRFGNAQTAEDATSIDRYGPRDYSVTGLLFQSDSQSRGLAERTVYRNKDPQVRLDAFTVEPQYKPAVWADNLGLELGDHIAFEIQTAGTLSRVSTQLDVGQISERFTPSQYQFTILGEARDPNLNNYFTWGGTSTQSWGTGVWA